MNDFSELDDFPPAPLGRKPELLPHKLLGELGKARSAGDLCRKKTQVRTFQQLNIMKLPSVDSDLGSKKSVTLSGSFESLAEEELSERRSQYEMK